jgi:phosphodiesterase/alkaline phosphatase D-like protein
MAHVQASMAHGKCLLSEVMMIPLAVINQRESLAERVPLSILRQLGAIDQDVYINLDRWDGYPGERSRLVQFIAD